MSKPTFNLLGDIVTNDSERWFESDVVPGMVIGWLNKQDGDVEININSNGGSVAGGLAIANAIKGYSKGTVTCNVLGLAASMASVVACAGHTLKMGQGAFLMVHNPWSYTMGNAEDLRHEAEVLDQMRDSIIGFYQSKSTKSVEELKALMDGETWISREQAEEFGFKVEDYEGELKAAASLTRRAFDKAPEAARQFLDFRAEKPAEDPATTAPAAVNWEARYKGLSAKFNEQKSAHDATVAELEKAHAAALAERDAKIADLTTQLDKSATDLADANAKVSELSAQVEEGAKALHAAQEDLTATRDSLTKAEDKVKHLESTRDLLTAGVLTPPAEALPTLQEALAKCNTPKEKSAVIAGGKYRKTK